MPWWDDLTSDESTNVAKNEYVTENNRDPISEKVTSPEQKKQFNIFLTILLVTLGITSLVIASVVMFHKYGSSYHSALGESSDVKYLQHNDEDTNGVEDSNSLIYQPSTSGNSSRSSIVSSGTSSFRVPVRPSPPVPSGKVQAEVDFTASLAWHHPVAALDSDWTGSPPTEEYEQKTPPLEVATEPPPVPPRFPGSKDNYNRLL